MKNFKHIKSFKHIVLLLVIILPLITFSSCTEQTRVRTLGGSMQVRLPVNKKLVMCTWKDSSLFYLLEDMEDTYVPKKKYFFESSALGVLQTEITFIETRKEYK